MINYITEDNYNELFNYRLEKYFKYRFSHVLNNLDIDKIKDTIDIDNFYCNNISKVNKCFFVNNYNILNNSAVHTRNYGLYKSYNSMNTNTNPDKIINSLNTIHKFISDNKI